MVAYGPHCVDASVAHVSDSRVIAWQARYSAAMVIGGLGVGGCCPQRDARAACIYQLDIIAIFLIAYRIAELQR